MNQQGVKHLNDFQVVWLHFFNFGKYMFKRFLDVLVFVVFNIKFRKKTIDSKKLRNILVVNFQGIGDLLMLTPMIENLKIHYGKNVKITILGYRKNGIVFRNDKQIEYLSYEGGVKNFARLLLALRKRKFDIVFNSFRAEHSALFSVLLKSSLVCGYLYSPKFRANFDFDKKKIDSRREPKANGLNFVNALGIKPKFNRCDMKLVLDKKDFAKSKSYLKKGKNIVIFTDNQWIARSWPPENWVSLVGELLEDSKKNVYLIGVGNDVLVHKILVQKFSKHNNFYNLLGKLDFLETGAFLSQVDTFVTTDGGPMNLAFSVRCKKVIGLFGCTDPKLYFCKQKNNVYLSDEDYFPKWNYNNEPVTDKYINISFAQVLKEIK